jgi:hypothetical protein
VTVWAVPVPLLVAVLATIAWTAVPDTSAPVTSNSVIVPPVVVPDTVALQATDVGDEPAFATRSRADALSRAWTCRA